MANKLMDPTKCIDSFKGDYRFLSNFAPCNVVYDGWYYPSVEHAYQAAKTDDTGIRRKIQSCGTASEAKKWGQAIAIFIPDWSARRLSVMKNLLEQKFNYPLYKTKLLDTGDAQLVEGNTWGDIYWGICNNKGENNLGILLMEIRDKLRNVFDKEHETKTNSR
jgi:ribA/ribD-fused uncharacterized protein